MIQKIWADKELRDEFITQLTAAIGDSPTWTGSMHIDARESGTFEITFRSSPGSRSTRRNSASQIQMHEALSALAPMVARGR